MSAYPNQQQYQPSSGGSGPPPAQKNTFRKGLGFVPNTIGKTMRDPISDLLKEAPSIPKGQCANSEQASILYESGSTVPLFNIENIAQAEGEERAQLIQSFGIALMQVGFIGIKAENLQPLINTAYNEMLRYFHQPIETKLLDWQMHEPYRGFSYRGCEIGPKAPRPDFKESFFITPDFSEWPANFPSFSRVMKEYHSILSEVYKYLMMFLWEFLGQNNERIENEYANNILRLAYYPAFKPGDDPQGIWSAAHRDKNVLTILSKATVPGLQFYSSNGLWEPVVVPDSYLIIGTGMLLQHKTAGMIRARWHRVINPGGKYTRLQRLSTVFYGNWPEDYSLNPLPVCATNMTRGMIQSRSEAYLSKYPDITVGEKTGSRRTAALI